MPPEKAHAKSGFFGRRRPQNRLIYIQLRPMRPVPQQRQRRQTHSNKLDLVDVNADFVRQGEKDDAIISVA